MDLDGELGKQLWWRTFNFANNARKKHAHEQATDQIEKIISQATEAADDPNFWSPTANAHYDPELIEGERLGALASRLGLQSLLDDSSHQTMDWLFFNEEHRGEAA
ncbi:hypothetical protein [Amycolatopsis dongchuanensis]|uniref:Uncharacterized protein n=1 Tax=Amycolatopsis dongchuanensis TaxID=1070866 RepID=A0ABP9QC13_9PSEU